MVPGYYIVMFIASRDACYCMLFAQTPQYYLGCRMFG